MAGTAPGCDHGEVTGPDLLESGSARPPSRSPSHRRLIGLVVALALAAGALVLASRASPDAPEPDRPAPTAVAVTPLRPHYYVYDVALANGKLYAVAGFCVGRCGYRLLAWDGTSWATTPLTVPADATSPGRLLVTGARDRYLAVLDGTAPGAYVSTDGGTTFGIRPGGDGAPVPAVPAGLVPELGTGGVGVFDPAAGRWHPLASQPMPGVLAVTATRTALYAAARSGSALVVATSRDAGRSWTRTTVTSVRFKTPELDLVPADNGSAYLVVTRPLPAGEPGVASVWHGGPAWTRVIDYAQAGGGTPKFTTAVTVSAGGVLLPDGSSGGQLAYDTGRTVNFYLPAGRVGDPPLVPSLLRRGTDGTVAAITADGWHVLIRHDRDVGWSVVPLPG
jgi:hypothetical protein